MEEHALSNVNVESSASRIQRGLILYETTRTRRPSVGASPAVNTMMGEIVRYQSKGPVRLVDAFRQLDDNGDGRLSQEELMLCAKKLGIDLSPEEVHCLVQILDKNGDGNVELEEVRDFIKVYRKRLMCAR